MPLHGKQELREGCICNLAVILAQYRSEEQFMR